MKDFDASYTWRKYPRLTSDEYSMVPGTVPVSVVLYKSSPTYVSKGSYLQLVQTTKTTVASRGPDKQLHWMEWMRIPSLLLCPQKLSGMLIWLVKTLKSVSRKEPQSGSQGKFRKFHESPQMVMRISPTTMTMVPQNERSYERLRRKRSIHKAENCSNLDRSGYSWARNLWQLE